MQSSSNSKMKAEKKFAIVSFPDEDENLFIVASQWLLQDKLSYFCLWPPYTSKEKVRIAVLKNEKPDVTWNANNANLVIKCKTYEGAESIRDSIMKISARRSSLLFNQLQESMSSQTKPHIKELPNKSCVFSDSTLLIFTDIIRKLYNRNIEVSFSLKEASKMVSAENLIAMLNLHTLKASTSCQTGQVNTSSNINAVCDSCKSKASVKCPNDTSISSKGDVTCVGTRLHCITCTKEHKDKSLEELRLEDLMSRVNISEKVADNNNSVATSISNCNADDELKSFDSTGAANSATLSWSAVKFKPPTETKVVMKENTSIYVGTRLQCITCMKEYEDKSFEELRMGDLRLGVPTFPQFENSQQKTTQKAMHDTIDANVFAPKWTANKFKPPTETNVSMIADIPFYVGTRLQCITCMKEYEDKSLEELRVEELSYGTFKTSVQPPNPFKDEIKQPEASSFLSQAKFRPFTGSDTMRKSGKEIPINTRLQSITCMLEYEDKSFEELRMEYLVIENKGSSPVGMVFQTPAQLPHLIKARTTASTPNYKPVFDPTGIANGFKRTEASRYPAIKFKPVKGFDTTTKAGKEFPIKTRLQSITCMLEYEDKSFEELRVEELNCGTFKTSVQPPNPFTATFPFSSTFAFTFKKQIRKPRIYPLSFGILGIEDEIKPSEASSFPSQVKFRPIKRPEASSFQSQVQFRPFTGFDTMRKAGKEIPINTRLQSITCMLEYEDKSFEELRVESPVQSTASTFTFTGKESKPAFDTQDITNSFNGCSNKNTFGVNVQPVWNHSTFHGSSFSFGVKTLFKI